MNSKIVIGLIITVLGLPLSFALDCSKLANQELCEEIMNSGITTEEKDYLLADIMSDSKHYPDHEMVRSWNSRISTATAPNGIAKQNNGYIKNAWVKLLAVMPSVLENNVLYIPKNGQILTGANHDVQIPSGTEAGDCRTERSLIENTANIMIYTNGRSVGSGNKVSYTVSGPHRFLEHLLCSGSRRIYGNRPYHGR